MRLEWIEDILAVADTGSMLKAAERRCLTQSAFSRRLRLIEEQLGAELFDRSRKPATLYPAVLDLCAEMRDLAGGLRRLRTELGPQGGGAQNRIVIASQHAITAALAPLLIQRMVGPDDRDIRLRSANRDECYALLLTRQADFMLFYSTDQQPLSMERGFVEHCLLGTERLIPVFSGAARDQLDSALARRDLPVIVYPRDVFLGKVVHDEIWSRLDAFTFRPKAETALTLAAVQFATMGLAVAWVPQSLARDGLDNGTLIDLSVELGAQDLALTCARLSGGHSPAKQATWDAMRDHGRHLMDGPATDAVPAA